MCGSLESGEGLEQDGDEDGFQLLLWTWLLMLDARMRNGDLLDWELENELALASALVL